MSVEIPTPDTTPPIQEREECGSAESISPIPLVIDGVEYWHDVETGMWKMVCPAECGYFLRSTSDPETVHITWWHAGKKKEDVTFHDSFVEDMSEHLAHHLDEGCVLDVNGHVVEDS